MTTSSRLDLGPDDLASPRKHFQHGLLVVALSIASSGNAAASELPTETDQDRIPSLHTGGNVAIVGATVHPVIGPPLVNVTVVVRDGKIVSLINGELRPDGEIATIDATGFHVTPGIIDCHSHIAIRGGTNESSASVTAEVRIADEVNGDDLSIYRALAGGCTTANLLHGSANAIGGQNAVIKLKYRRPAAELLFPGAPRGIKFALGENPSRKSGNDGRYPTSRMGVEATLRRSFIEAEHYRDEWLQYQEALIAGGDPEEPRRDLRLETLVGVLDGEILVHSHCYQASEILMLIRVAEEFGFTVASFQHVLEGYKVAPEIAAHGAGGSTFSDWWGFKWEASKAIPYNAAIMHDAGIVVSLNSDSSELMRRLNLEAAKVVKWGGVDRRDALAMVTLNPARQLGIDARVGSIEEGKDADLVVWSGDPLSAYSRVLYTLVDGEVEFQRDGHPSALDVDWEGIATPDPAQPPTHVTPIRRDVTDRLAGSSFGGTPGSYAIVLGRIVPVDGPVIEVGTILINDGRIVDVFAERADSARYAAQGYEVIDASGLSVYPGMIDPSTSLGVSEISSVPGSVDTREQGAEQPDLRIAVAVDPDSDYFPVARSEGVLTGVVRPRGALIAGQSVLMHLDGRTYEQMTLVDPLALHVNTPGWGGGVGIDDARTKQLLAAFSSARAYGDAKASAVARGVKSPPLDPRYEAILPYARGERPVIFDADDEKAIAQAVSLAGRLGVSPIVNGGREAWKVADLLARFDVPVFLGAVLTNPSERHDPYDSPFANAAVLSRAGVRFAFSTGGGSAVRNLPQHAAMSVAFGLDPDEALAAVTLRGAEILGVDHELGSITKGKIADLVVTNGDLLEVTTQVKQIWISGRRVSTTTHQSELRDRYRKALESKGSDGGI